jgi:hypothetical protein
VPAKSSFSSRETELSIAATTPDQVLHQSNQICDSEEEPNQHVYYFFVFFFQKMENNFIFFENLFVCFVFENLFFW